MPPDPGRTFEFGRFRLDTGQGVLLRDGERVALIPKAVDLLAVLVAAAGRVVTKEQLLEAVWPDAFVQEGNLSKLVFLLRRELDAAPGSGQIETVSKRGYAFKGDVREITAPAGAAPPVSSSIAVLPFATSGAAPHLGESVAEEVLVALSRQRKIAVVARTSSFRFGGSALDVAEIGQRLRVPAIVEGSVRADGDRVRVTATLVDAGTAFQRWSRTFECGRSELSLLPATIADALIEVLMPAVPAAPAPPPERRVSPEAYDLYLQGRYFWNRRPGEATWRALECFEQATRIDPDFAEAWAGIADVYSTLGSWEAGVLPHDEAQQKARAFAERALALKPHLAEALTTLAYTALHYGWDPVDAGAGFAAALRANPTYAAAHHWQSHVLIVQGRMAESLGASRRALAHDPMNILLTAHLSWHHHMAREPEHALEQAERVIRLEPRFHWGHYFLSWAAESRGDVSRAVDAARTALRCMDGNPVMLALVGRALAVAGDDAGALAVLDGLARQDEGHARYAYEMALIHLGLHDHERALELLTRAHERRSGWMVYAHVDPRMDPLRADLRFAELVPVRNERAT
jgi:DNA-binding winged helix-turn-helix (wHTH) protein/tetratricopeptide (TPR) repeat protein